MLRYLPGCDVTALHPQAIAVIQKYMSEKGFSNLQCCRKDISSLQDGDILIMNCTQCQMIMAERAPEVRRLSLYEYLLTEPDWKWPDYQGVTMPLQDCWRMRDNPALHKAVRECLERMHIRVIEMEDNKEKSTFCGVWMNNPAVEECVHAAPETFARLESYRCLLSEDAQRLKMQEYVKRFENNEVIVYCNGCEKGIRLGGKKPVHLLDLISGVYKLISFIGQPMSGSPDM